MSKRARRIIVTFAVCLFAGLIAAAVFYGKSRPNRSAVVDRTTSTENGEQATVAEPRTSEPAATSASQDTAPPTQAVQGDPANEIDEPAQQQDADAEGDQQAEQPGQAAIAPQASGTPRYRAVAAGNDRASRDDLPLPLGSLDPRRDLMRVTLSRFGAGIARIDFSDHWHTALARRQAARYFKSLTPDAQVDLTMLPDDQRYTLVERSPIAYRNAEGGVTGYSGIPVLAVSDVVINGFVVDLISPDAWSETSPGVFESVVLDEHDRRIASVTRRYHLLAGYDITVEQRIRNISDGPLDVRWNQFGPVDLPEDVTSYIPRRRFHFGYLPDPVGRPALVLADDSKVMERSSLIKQYSRSMSAVNPALALEQRTLWPTAETRAAGHGLSWFGATNRYFGLAVHPPLGRDAPVAYSLEKYLNTVEVGVSNLGVEGMETVYSVMRSPAVALAAGEEYAFDVAIYAGPLDRHALGKGGFGALGMSGMIIYSMSGCCTFLTFQWLAHLLLWFCSFLHDFVFFDWGLAIIGLVIVVRTLLHPLTKKAQINMMRFGKQMQALKPEIDKLQKKYGNDKQKMQQEQIRLMREHNINPLQVLGCLPMFLQMPIWIALWAALYLAFDLRQEPAFYGVFQLIADNWPFLADLSSPDSFIPFGAGFAIPLLGTIRGLNILPILMGVVFFIQQKYMTPPTTANMTPEQIQQQKIMKWMMVIIFPVIMYNTPSGLTLYILTSSIIGILESRYVRRHIDQLDLTPTAPKPKTDKPRDALGRAWAKRLESIKDKQRQSQQAKQSFKKRKP